MPIGTRDILLVIRAKDQASRVVAQIGASFDTLSGAAEASAFRMLGMGSALVGIGTALTAAGAAGLSATKEWTDAAADYNAQAALTLTQVDQLGVTLEDVKKIGRDVAAEIPAPFEQMQSALFDIFSSMDVNIEGAEKLLSAFSQAAVAGNVDIQTAGRATISIMNAWGLKAKDVNHVMDVQFQLVRKGVGTYKEFATAIGKSIPSARRAGQSVESLAGVLAFMTRNGLSAQMAATSAARAFDNLANPKVQKRMHDLGVEVLDGNGNFRQMADIVRELGQQMAGLTDAQKAKALNALFAGSGNNIQARRFWDLAIRNFGQLNDLTDDMINSSGALDAAYDIMFNQPVNQVQLLKNNLDILKTELGDALLPAFNKVVEKLTGFVKWIRNLSPETKKFIAHGAAILSLIAILSGVVMGISGAVLMIGGAIKLMGGLSNVIGMIVKMNFWILLIAAAAYLIYRNWDTIKAWWEKLWPHLKETAEKVWSWLKSTWEELWPKVKEVAKAVWDWIKSAWTTLWPIIRDAAVKVWDWIVKTWTNLWPKLKAAASIVWEWIKTNWPVFMEALRKGIQVMKDIFSGIWHFIKTQVIDRLVAIWSSIPFKKEIAKAFGWLVDTLPGWFSKAWDRVKQFASNVWGALKGLAPLWKPIVEAVKHVWNVFKDLIGIVQRVIQVILVIARPVIAALIGAFVLVWEIISNTFGPAFSMIGEVINAVIDIIKGVIGFVVNLINGDWRAAWDSLVGVVIGIWDAFFAFLRGIYGIVKGALGAVFDFLVGAGKYLLQGFWNGLKAGAKAVYDFFVGIGRWMIDTFKAIFGIKSPSTVFFDIGINILKGLWNGLKSFVDTIWGFFKGVGLTIVSYFVGAITWLWDKGAEILRGLWGGIKSIWSSVTSWFGGLFSKVLGFFGGAVTWLWDVGKNILQGLWNGLKDMWNRVWDWLQDKASSIGGIFTSVLSIFSPSRVFHNIGENIMLGLLNGLDSLSSDLDKQMNLTANAVVAPMTGLQPSFAAPRSAPTGRTVNVAQGAVQVTVSGANLTEGDVEIVINRAFEDLMRQMVNSPDGEA